MKMEAKTENPLHNGDDNIVVQRNDGTFRKFSHYFPYKFWPPSFLSQTKLR